MFPTSGMMAALKITRAYVSFKSSCYLVLSEINYRNLGVNRARVACSKA